MTTIRRLFLAALVLGLMAPLANASGLVVVDEAFWGPPGQRPSVIPPPWPPPRSPELPPHPWPRFRPHVFAPLELSSHEARVTIVDQLARVTIEQVFVNPNNHRMEGTFLFPMPRGAQLAKFTMKINGKAVEAELLAADKARRIYEDIVRKLKDPALLEYSEQSVYKVRIFPIEPQERKHVSVVYEQLLGADHGLVEFRLPLGAGRFSSRPVPKLLVDIQLGTRRPLKSVYSPTHTAELRRDGERRARMTYEASNTVPDTDLSLFFDQGDDPVGVQLLAHRTDEDEGTFLLLMSPGFEADNRRVVPKDVVFVLDTSGSMAGAKLEQARKALLFCVENLNEQDRFEVLRFSTETEPVFRKLAEVQRESRSRAEEFIRGLKPIGGTAIDAALREALSLRSPESKRPFVVIFLTDGLPTVGVTAEEEILANVKKVNQSRTRVFCFGIGNDVNTHLLDKITEVTRASSQYVLPEEDLEVKLSNFFARIKDPVLVNPRLDWGDGVRITRVYPSPLPDLFRGEQVVVVGRYRGRGDVAVRLVGEVEGRERSLTHEVRFPERAVEHEFIPRLWATRRVGHLLEEIRLHGDQTELRDEVIELARRYGIVTPYTAWLIVEDEARRGLSLNLQSLPTLQRDTAARQVAGDQYQTLMMERYGLAPVARSRSDAALKQAQAPVSAIQLGQAEAARGLGGVPAAPASGPVPVSPVPSGPAGSDSRRTVVATAQQVQYAGGRAFYWNNDRWLDTTVQQQSQARRRQISFGSPEYFELTRRHPESQAWLALGTRVEFVLGSTVYEIQE